MLEVHAPHESTHTLKDFLIHIATIVVGLLIAVGLEQLVESIHHHHQRTELTGQMRAEAEHNLPLERDSISRLLVQISYMKELRSTLLAAVPSGDTVQIHGVVPRGGSVLHVSPSRSVWAAAQSAGIAAILPEAQAQLYYRRDFNSAIEVDSENDMYDQLRELIGQCDRAGFHYNDPSPVRLTLAQRGDLVLAVDKFELTLEKMVIRLALVEGADQALASNATTLEAMFPYQTDSVTRLHMASGLTGSFFGGSSSMDYQPLEFSAPNKP